MAVYVCCTLLLGARTGDNTCMVGASRARRFGVGEAIDSRVRSYACRWGALPAVNNLDLTAAGKLKWGLGGLASQLLHRWPTPATLTKRVLSVTFS
ncbi:hypothetical protein F5Y08DRAFT_104752 [Xylaria arbuscula]|nr:hypothetical protein F5Y08DRAFT_104752 [Xylaria arbuscula]